MQPQAIGGNGNLRCACRRWCISDWGSKRGARGAPSTDGLYDADKGAMKAEGQARLELPKNPGYTSMDFLRVRYWLRGACGPRG